MRHVPNERSNPFSDFAKLIKDQGYNKDVTLSFGTVTDVDPLTVKLDGNGLETTSLEPMPTLLNLYYPVTINFDDELGTRTGQIMIDNSLEVGVRVACIYDDTGNKLHGYILDKVEV